MQTLVRCFRQVVAVLHRFNSYTSRAIKSSNGQAFFICIQNCIMYTNFERTKFWGQSQPNKKNDHSTAVLRDLCTRAKFWRKCQPDKAQACT